MMSAHSAPAVTAAALRWDVAAMQRDPAQGHPADLT